MGGDRVAIPATLRRGAFAGLLAALLTATPAAARDAYVTNLGSASVSQYDVDAGGALAPKGTPTVAAGNAPFGVAVSPDGKSVYVSNSGSATISQYDVDAGGALAAKSPATVAAGNAPFGVAVSPDGRSVYVSNSGSANVSQYDVDAGGALAPKGTPTVAAGSFPQAVAVSPDGKSAYVTNNLGDGTVSQFDVGPGGALAAKSTPTVATGNFPVGVAVSPDGESAYVTNNFGAGTVSQYDAGPGGALAPKSTPTVAAGSSPQSVAVSPDGKSAYVTTSGLARVSQYDAGPGGALAAKSPPTVATGGTPFGVAVSPDQPPIASFSVSGTEAGAGASGLAGSTLIQTGRFAGFDSSASSDPDGEIATHAWEFGDGQGASNGGSTEVHAYFEPGTYTARLTLTDDEGCSTTLIFTGQTVSCNGGPVATTTREVVVQDGLASLAVKLSKRLAGSKLRAKVTCQAADCSATLRGNVRVKIRGRANAAAREVKPKSVDLAAAEKTTVMLRVPRQGRSALQQALRRGHRVKATVRAKAADVFDNVEKAKAAIRLR